MTGYKKKILSRVSSATIATVVLAATAASAATVPGGSSIPSDAVIAQSGNTPLLGQISSSLSPAPGQVRPFSAANTALGRKGAPPVSLNSFANARVGNPYVIGRNPTSSNPLGVSVNSPSQASGNAATVGLLSNGSTASANVPTH